MENPKDLIARLELHARNKVEGNVREINDEVFERTDCLACGNCCKSAPPIVTNQDIKRIAKHLKLSPKSFKRKYVLEDYNGELSFDRVPCPFLGNDNYCSIYEQRPQACRDFPHTTTSFFKRKKIHVINNKICPAVNEILEIMEAKFLKNIP